MIQNHRGLVTCRVEKREGAESGNSVVMKIRCGIASVEPRQRNLHCRTAPRRERDAIPELQPQEKRVC